MGARAALTGFALAVMQAGAGVALEIELPGSALLTRDIRKDATAYFVPTAPFDGTSVPAIEAEGAFSQQAWRMEAPGLTSLQLLRPLRDQIAAAGYEILLDCAALECGGFEFRFRTEVMPAPDMFVDLFDFRFLSARTRTASGAVDYVTVLVSRVSSSGYIQVIRLAQSAADADALGVAVVPDEPATPAPLPITAQTPVGEALLTDGHVVLGDLDFGSGSVSLGPGPFETLDALAVFLKEDDARRVALVGHTDTVGGLEPNVSLSRRRAAAVLERLVEAYDIPRTQLEAEGMGYLSPLASNRTPEGREMNRRVEAVLLNTE